MCPQILVKLSNVKLRIKIRSVVLELCRQMDTDRQTDVICITHASLEILIPNVHKKSNQDVQ
jgi:hypothetical protein